ncbi:hypothetical protein [Clostridium sp. OS1-26]|uniref:hypothetical protein n=1 Tax=Clostridium sp. OS1-26 TaxID=3070681 RepID=UPI0027E02C92|nr:hypothetical protein [Clostridium sp. OS1-26]WML33793.1 hypothetical protein RCG18_21025 [Clostridium sp. OS1-26]
MKSKKLLSSLMALSIIATSSVALGTTAKAATLNSTSTKTLSEPWVGYKLNADISSNGDITWCEVTAADYYQVKVNKVLSNGALSSVGGYSEMQGFDKTFHFVKELHPSVGTYRILVKAQKSGSNEVITSETFDCYYDGSKFYMKE